MASAANTDSDQTRMGDAMLSKAETCSSELFSLTYGAFVVQLLQDERNDVVEVNRQLDKVGYNIGLRIVDEFLVQTKISSCKNLRETADLMGRVAFKMFLGVTATVQDWAEDGSGFSFILPAKNNPLVEFVELPKEYADLTMCALVAGAVRGALEMIQVRVETSVIRDSLKGDDCTEIRVIRKGIIREEFNPGDD